MILTGCWGGEIYLWDSAEQLIEREALGIKITEIDFIRAHGFDVSCILELKQHKRSPIVASGSLDKTVKIWNIGDRTCLRTIAAQEWVLSLHQLPEVITPRELLLRTCKDGLSIWNWRTGKEARLCDCHPSMVTPDHEVQCSTVLDDGAIVVLREGERDEDGDIEIDMEIRRLWHRLLAIDFSSLVSPTSLTEVDNRKSSLVHMCCYCIAQIRKLRPQDIDVISLPPELSDLCDHFLRGLTSNQEEEEFD